jgi:hypothetical protein
MIHVNDTRKALVNGIKTVTIRKVTGKMITVSLGFDTKGNDITAVVNEWDILPQQ